MKRSIRGVRRSSGQLMDTSNFDSNYIKGLQLYYPLGISGGKPLRSLLADPSLTAGLTDSIRRQGNSFTLNRTMT
jgi:hypothetical protein